MPGRTREVMAMIKELVEQLNSAPLYYIKSTLSGELYLDENRQSYFFLYESNAKQFVETHKNTSYACVTFKNKDILESCYMAGASNILYDNGEKKEKIVLSQKVLRPGYYNNNINACISLYKQTRAHKYLKQLAASHFIVPVGIRKDETGQKIEYAVMKMENSTYYIAFANLAEYKCWAKNVKGWQPLIVNFDVMCQISKQFGFVINPMSNKIRMPGDVMEKYRKFSSLKEPNI